MLDLVKKYGKQKTTWAGAIGIVLSVGGWTLAPELKEAIMTAAVAITSLVLVIFDEEK